MGIMQRIERALFGATAEEAAKMRLKLIDQRIDQRLNRLADALEKDEDSTEEVQGDADNHSQQY